MNDYAAFAVDDTDVLITGPNAVRLATQFRSVELLTRDLKAAIDDRDVVRAQRDNTLRVCTALLSIVKRYVVADEGPNGWKDQLYVDAVALLKRLETR